MNNFKIKTFLLFTFFIYNIGAVEGQVKDNPFVCEEIIKEDPPFYISDEYKQGDKIWENLRDIDNPNNKTAYLPRGSIVHVPDEIYEDVEGQDYRLPVEVIKVPSKEWEEGIAKSRSRTKNGLRNTTWGHKGLDRAQKGSKGWVHKKALKKAGEFSFILTKDAPVYRGPSGVALNNNSFSLKMEGNKYVANRCCKNSGSNKEDICFDKYVYEIVNTEGEIIDTFALADEGMCSLLNYTMPINNKQIEPVRNILDMLRIENPEFAIDQLDWLPDHKYSWKGRLYNPRKEMYKIPFDDNGLGPFNSYHYKPDDRENSDAYMRPTSFCALTQVMKEFQKECQGPGCQVQLGDMYHHDNWGKHAEHDSGECVDIRPFRKNDDDSFQLKYYRQYSRYSRERTAKFIELLKKSGARSIIYNDRKIPGIIRDKNNGKVHDDHIHVCFGENMRKVKRTCRDGLN